ncbi:MAG: hypothetical protein JNK82_45070, partial [Myxococcaceae bacterium]|nr:hypothetical protein [Myxococcaceae bacterium]
SELQGLDEVTRTPPPPGVHGGLLLGGNRLPGSQLELLEHQAQWWTARWGGVGTGFFAEAGHQPVQRRAGAELPASLGGVIVHGDRDPGLNGLTLVQSAGRWRRYEHPRR